VSTFCLITATLLAGQAPDTRLSAVPTDGGAVIVAPGAGCNCNRDGTPGAWQQGRPYPDARERGGLLSRLGHRLRSLFGDDEQSQMPANGFRGDVIAAPAAPAAPAPVVMSEPPLADQVQAQPAATYNPIKVTVRSSPAAQAPTGAVRPQTAVQKVEEKQGSSLTGRLAFLPSNGGTWMVHYGEPGADANGGLVVLSTAASMAGFRDGDRVTVEGDFLNGQANTDLGAPIYRAHTVRLIEHAQ
jgi:hypothetical protein